MTNPEVEAENKGKPQVLETKASNQPGREVPALTWAIEETGLTEPRGRGTNFSYTATFSRGRERVSVRVLWHDNEAY